MRRFLEIVGIGLVLVIGGCVWLDRNDYADRRATALNEAHDMAVQHDQEITDLNKKVSDLEDRVDTLERERHSQ